MKERTREVHQHLQREREGAAQHALAAAESALARAEHERLATERALQEGLVPAQGELAGEPHAARTGLELKRAAAHAARKREEAEALRAAHAERVARSNQKRADKERAQAALALAHESTRAAERKRESAALERQRERDAKDELDLDDRGASTRR